MKKKPSSTKTLPKKYKQAFSRIAKSPVKADVYGGYYGAMDPPVIDTPRKFGHPVYTPMLQAGWVRVERNPDEEWGILRLTPKGRRVSGLKAAKKGGRKGSKGC